MAHSNLRNLYGTDDNLAQLASLSCFSQNSNAYNFLSNEIATLKLRTRTRFDEFFPGIDFFLSCRHLTILKITRQLFMNSKGDQFLKKLWCWVGGGVIVNYTKIWFINGIDNVN